jgi:hypothetical protein
MKRPYVWHRETGLIPVRTEWADLEDQQRARDGEYAVAERIDTTGAFGQGDLFSR